MGVFFVGIYRFFQQRPWAFRAFLLVLSGSIIWQASRIRLEEDISRITGRHDSLSRDEYVIRNFSFAEKLVVHLRQADTTGAPMPDSLISLAEAVSRELIAGTDSTTVRELFLRIPENRSGELLKLIGKSLPVFLEEPDYQTMDSLTDPARIRKILQRNYKILVSPASLALKGKLSRDPLGISDLVLRKLSTLQIDPRYQLYRGYILSQDLRHLLFFITPAHPPSETNRNGQLIGALDKAIQTSISKTGGVSGNNQPSLRADYFGAAAVAVGNAKQLKRDILVSLSLAILAILALLGWYFRNAEIPFLGFLPAFFGGGFSLALLCLVKGTVSVIALGIGSVILGLIIDYALYMINHYRLKRDVEKVLREMSQTIVVCSLTTIGAFLCLVLLNSAVLHDLGWFAAISVSGAAFFALVILPHFLGPKLLPKKDRPPRVTFIDRFSAMDFGKKPWLIIGITAAGIASFFFLRHVLFEKNLHSLSYMPEHLRQSEEEVNRLSGSGLKNVYIISTGDSLEESLRSNENAINTLALLKKEHRISSVSGITGFLVSDSLQQIRLKRWHAFWDPGRIDTMKRILSQAGRQWGFSERAFDGFLDMVTKSWQPLSPEETDFLIHSVFGDWIRATSGLTMVTAMAHVGESDKQEVYRAFTGDRRFVVFDRQYLTERFVDNVKIDFDRLIKLSMIFVSLLLLLSFGRIELGFTTAIPMFASWLITLGFMGLFGIRFNIFNIIICSFVFGLGVDYSILMMRGLLSEYRTGVRELATYQTSIFLSAATTLLGVAALFAARHPALRSIALIALVGIISVVLVSWSYQSLLTQWFLFRPRSRNKFPASLGIVLYSIFISWIPISTIALILVIYGVFISPILPVSRKKKQEIFHRIFCRLSKMYIAMNFPRYHRIDNPGEEAFRNPAIIISNHQSLIETPALLRLNPNILILTTSWVYRHWVFGPVARLAGFPPISEGVEQSLENIRQQLQKGHSILIFPEGTRSPDGRIQRFHRGAFFLAEKLQADILPILIFGSGDFLPKGNFWGRPNRLYMKILPRITPDDARFGTTYQERARQVRQYYAREYSELKTMKGTPEYYRPLIRLSYLFKGPVLEWYVRMKMRMEGSFRMVHALLPTAGKILDLGCGYGYVTYLLMLTADSRTLTGVDYDEEKIIIARNSFLYGDRIRFICQDIAGFPLFPCDGIFMGDVLHYLPPEIREKVIRDCIEALNPGGVIVIREGIRELKSRHKGTRLSEFFSTRITHFNQTRNERKQLWFISAEEIRAMAGAFGCAFEILDQGKRTSNVLMVIRKPGDRNC